MASSDWATSLPVDTKTKKTEYLEKMVSERLAICVLTIAPSRTLTRPSTPAYNLPSNDLI